MRKTQYTPATQGSDLVAFVRNETERINNAMESAWTHEVLDGPEGERRPLGRYDDVYVKRGGEWLYSERRFNMRRP